MNRSQRRRAQRLANRALARGHVDAGDPNNRILASCGWSGCELPGALVFASDISEASDKLRAHYAQQHQGREP